MTVKKDVPSDEKDREGEVLSLLARILKLEQIKESQANTITSMTGQISQLVYLKKMERAGAFKDISAEDLDAFEHFESKIMQCPPSAHDELVGCYRAAWERSYWFGYYQGRGLRS